MSRRGSTSTLASTAFVEFNVGNILVEQVIKEPFNLDEDGCLPVPQGPGLGVEIDRQQLSRLQADGYASESWTWDINKEFEAK